MKKPTKEELAERERIRELTDEEKAIEWRKWVDTRPARVRDALLKYVPTMASCYKLKSARGHYMLERITEPLDLSKPIACHVIHGRDSTSPGIAVFGVALEDLIPCGCGKWEFPTPEQIEETKLRMTIFKAQHLGHTNKS